MKGKKDNRQKSEVDKMKLEGQQKQGTSKNSSKKQQNQNLASTVNSKPSKNDAYELWGENSFTSKSDGWSSIVQNHKKPNSSNPWSSRSTAFSDDIWDDSESHFPKLGAEAPPPRYNVWEERKYKAEAIKALEPQNQYDEEAMLKQALEMSLREAAKEEEKQRREEEAYQLQMEALKIEEEERAFRNQREALQNEKEEKASRNHMGSSKIEEEQKKLRAPSPPLSCRSDLESPVLFHSVKVENSVDAHSNIKTVSDFNKQEKDSNSGGARPKINKVIERFGGWGLSEKDKAKAHSNGRNKSKNVVDLVDNILEGSKSSLKGEPVVDKIFEKKEVKVNKGLNSNKDLDIWCTPDADDIKTVLVPSSNDKEILFDGKCTFTELVDENDFDSDENYEYAASCDSMGTSTEEKISVETPALAKSKNDDLANTTCFANEDSLIFNKADGKEQKEITTNSYNLFENTYNYVSNDSVVNSFQSTGYSTPRIPSGDPWANSPLKTSVSTEIFPNRESCETSELKHETGSLQCTDFIENKTHPSEEFGSQTNTESRDVFSQLNVTHADALGNNKMPVTDTESHILPPHPLNNLSHFPTASNPVFPTNPMFPGSMNFSPMYGYFMDPVMMQQMLLLSNPFFTSQLLAMEQYYRSMGMHSNVFSVQPQVIPGPTAAAPPSTPTDMFDAPSELNSEHNVTNTGMPASTYNPDFPNPSLTDLSKSVPGNNYEASSAKHIKPPGLDISIAQPDISNTSREEEGNDSWFKSYLCDENALPIPPPKPAVLNVESNSSVSVPKSHVLSQNSSSFHPTRSRESKNDDVTHKPVSSAQEFKRESLTAIEACVTKTTVHGWSDSEDETPAIMKPKSTYCEGDGWNNDSMPTKCLKNSTVYEERRKTAYRQPASQPQVSRFQRNKMHK